MERSSVLKGFAIVIVDRGFVYVGETTADDEWCVIEEARNIRKWGTTKGLGQLALYGPTSETCLDMAGTVRVPTRALISLLDTEKMLWSS